MAGWLGANFTSQLDQFKKGVSQVSSIVKDTLVVDEEWDKAVDANGDIIEREEYTVPVRTDDEYQMDEKCSRLEELRKAAIQEKESQCQTFRELLMEKENEVQELSKMVKDSQISDNFIDDLKEVFNAAGKSCIPDNNNAHLLELVKNLVNRDATETVEKGDKSTHDDVINKLGDENEVLSRECKVLNEKLKLSEFKIAKFEAKDTQKCDKCDLYDQDAIDSIKQSNIKLTETNESQKLLIGALKATKDESQEMMKESYELKMCVSEISEEKDSLLKQIKETNIIMADQEKLSADLQDVVSRLEAERDSKDQDFVTKISSEMEKSKSLDLINKEIKINFECATQALNTANEELHKLSEIKTDLLQSAAKNKVLENQIQHLETTCKNLREEGNEESIVINQLQEEVDSSKEMIAKLSVELNTCKQENNSINSVLNLQEIKFVEERNIIQNKLVVKDASYQELIDKGLMIQKELDASKHSNENLVEEINICKSSIYAVSQKNVASLAEIEESHQQEVSVIKQEMSDIRTEIMTEMAESYKSEISALKIREQELLDKFVAESATSRDFQSNVEESNNEVISTKNYCLDLKSQLKENERGKKDLQSNYDALLINNQELQTKLNASHESEMNNTQEIQSKLDNAEELYRSLQLKIDSSEKGQSHHHDLENRLDQAQKSNQELQLKLDLELSSHQEQLDALQNKLNRSESELQMINEMEEKLVDADNRNALILEEQQMLKEKNSEVQLSLNASKQEVEDLKIRVSDLITETNLSKASSDELQKILTLLDSKVEQFELENREIKAINHDLNLNLLLAQENCELLNKKLSENGNQFDAYKTKEADFTEAINSLKSINEVITKSARDNEKGKKEIETTYNKVLSEKKLMEQSIKSFDNKNLELISQVKLISDQKKELEYCYVESQNSIAGLKAEIKQLIVAKESTVSDEKDVDETEQSAIDKNMVQVLNEKIRECTRIKSENNFLIQNLTVEREAKEKLEAELAENKQTYSSMNTEAVRKLSMLVRDKDLEVESLSERNKTLLEIIQNEKEIEKMENVNEASLLEEIKKLKDEKIKNKESIDNSNELIYLKGRIEEFERDFNDKESDKINEISKETTQDTTIHDNKQQEIEVCDRSLALRLETKSIQLTSVEKQAGLLGQELVEVRIILSGKEEQLVRLTEQCSNHKGREVELQQEVERVRRSLVSMQGMLEEKTTSNVSQQEQGLKYIGECDRLSKELSQMTSERDIALTEGKARIQEAQDLRREVSSIIEKKKRVEGEVERLRGHLVQVEEGYTVELMDGESREKELRKKVGQLEDHLRVATHTSSEVSENASQASTHLTAALETAASQRDKLSDQFTSCQATLRTRNMELRNLQSALEGFQKQKDNELGQAEKNCEERVAREQKVVGELQEKLRVNKQQLDRAQQGLEAAARLSEQLDKKGSVITNLKQEISVREEMVKNTQAKLLVLSNGHVGKVDRDLVKNLLVGYVTTDDSKKSEVLRIIATVLDFNSEERGRTGLEGGAGGWLGGLLGSRSRHPSISQAPVEQSIAKAFIQFLEEESTPKNIVTLPVLEMARSKAEQLAGRSGKAPSPLLSASPTFSLPSLASYNSHSPSILKSVLDEPEKEISS